MYETFEHTADVGIRVRAGDEAELFSEAARGLFSLMTANLDAVRPLQEVRIELVGENIEELLHDWLAELLFQFHGNRLVLAEFHVAIRGTPPALSLSATARGEPIDARRHEIGEEIKAITWHELKVERQPDGWLAEVIVDL